MTEIQKKKRNTAFFCVLVVIAAILTIIMLEYKMEGFQGSQMFFLLLSFGCLVVLLLSLALHAFWSEQYRQQAGLIQLYFAAGGIFTGLVSFYRFEISMLIRHHTLTLFTHSGGIVHLALLALNVLFLYVAWRNCTYSN